MKYKAFYLLIISLLICSCSPQKRLAREFATKSKNAVIALYVADSIVKINVQENLSLNISDSSLACRDSSIIVNALNDNVFFDILISSFESAINDYGIQLEYWEDGKQQPDTLHWIVDIPKIEITEYHFNYNATRYNPDSGYYLKQIAVNEINVASWLNISNGLTNDLTFTEQNLIDNITHSYDYDSYEAISYSVDRVSIDNLYRFAAFLGRLYAGYCFDYLMNDYIEKRFPEDKDKQYLTDMFKVYRYRYDPYEDYFFYTTNDRLIIVK